MSPNQPKKGSTKATKDGSGSVPGGSPTDQGSCIFMTANICQRCGKALKQCAEGGGCGGSSSGSSAGQGEDYVYNHKKQGCVGSYVWDDQQAQPHGRKNNEDLINE